MPESNIDPQNAVDVEANMDLVVCTTLKRCTWLAVRSLDLPHW